VTLAIELGGHRYSRLRQSDDFRDGVEAFHGKRKAKFRGSLPGTLTRDLHCNCRSRWYIYQAWRYYVFP
jgi:hypothetical protein